jgi:hypothetical protein
MARQKVEALGAQAVRSAVLYAHTKGASFPDYIGLISDGLILNPWDREVFKDGEFQVHPEYVTALSEQGLKAEKSLLIQAPTIEIAKGWVASVAQKQVNRKAPGPQL